jgi:drug/metabolite transporter (DMT)-like permease
MSAPPADTTPLPASAVTAALVGATVISFSAILYRLADTGPVTAAFFRMAYAVPVLGMIWAIQRSSDARTVRQRLLAVGAGVFLAADVVVWQVAIDQIGAGLGTLIVNSQVVLVPFVTWALFGERPSRRAIIAMPLVMTGLAAITGLGSPDTFGERPVFGVAMGAVAALFYTAFLVTYRRAGQTSAPTSGPLLDATVGATAALAIYGFSADAIDPTFTWPTHGWLALLAVGSQVVGWLAIGFALPRLPAVVTSFAVLLQPTLTMAWGRMIFSERIGTVQLAGVALVLGGIAAVTWTRSPIPTPSRR